MKLEDIHATLLHYGFVQKQSYDGPNLLYVYDPNPKLGVTIYGNNQLQFVGAPVCEEYAVVVSAPCVRLEDIPETMGRVLGALQALEQFSICNETVNEISSHFIEADLDDILFFEDWSAPLPELVGKLIETAINQHNYIAKLEKEHDWLEDQVNDLLAEIDELETHGS